VGDCRLLRKEGGMKMLKRIMTGAAVLAGVALFAGPTVSQAASPSGAKLSQAECDTLWNQANPSNSPTLSKSLALPYVKDFKNVDADNDGTISQAEFNKGCQDGLVKSSGGMSGSSSGTSGSFSNSSGAGKY
jgi:hypothetical protein